MGMLPSKLFRFSRLRSEPPAQPTQCQHPHTPLHPVRMQHRHHTGSVLSLARTAPTELHPTVRSSYTPHPTSADEIVTYYATLDHHGGSVILDPTPICLELLRQ